MGNPAKNDRLATYQSAEQNVVSISLTLAKPLAFAMYSMFDGK